MIPDMMSTEQDLQDAFKTQIYKDRENGFTGKYQIVFKTPVHLIQNRCHKKVFKQVCVKLFFSGQTLCYTFYRRTGYSLFAQVRAQEIERLEQVPQDEYGALRLKRALILLRRIDCRCWDTIRNRTPEQVCAEFADSNLLPFSFIPRFPRYKQAYLRAQMQAAFEHKKDFSFHSDGKKRDLSVETKLGEDGVFRAWFSSEYSGCANGDYYLVISPTQAVYYERD